MTLTIGTAAHLLVIVFAAGGLYAGFKASIRVLRADIAAIHTRIDDMHKRIDTALEALKK